MDRYTHVGITDLTAALDRLPELPGEKNPQREATVLLATGTDNTRRLPDGASAGQIPVAHLVAHDVAHLPVPARSRRPGKSP